MLDYTAMKIKEILPHRDPFLFIDGIASFNEATREIECYKTFLKNDYILSGHFPGNPIIPGVILTEMMAQASILLYAGLKPEISSQKPSYYLGKNESRFLKIAYPDQKLIIKAKINTLLDTGGIVQAEVSANNTIVAKSELLFAVKPKN